jgi:hypothetical protein
MDKLSRQGSLLARCIVCRGNIHEGESYEIWEGGYYCERHSLPHLRERARLYAELLRAQVKSEPDR